MSSANSPIIRINITVPKNLIDELEKEVPNRGKSGFITKAIEEKLERERREKAIVELRDAPATFTHIKNSVKYVNKMRKLDEKREKRLYK